MGDEIYFQHPDGTWEGGKAPDQTVMIEVIIIYMEEIRSIIRQGLRRPEDVEGKIERKRGRRGRKPVFAGTRIPVETVTRRLAIGQTDKQIIESYPDLTAKEQTEPPPQKTRSGTAMQQPHNPYQQRKRGQALHHGLHTPHSLCQVPGRSSWREARPGMDIEAVTGANPWPPSMP